MGLGLIAFIFLGTAGGGGGGEIKTTATTGPTRRALSTLNENIIEVPSYPFAVNKRSLSESVGICNKPPVHRPITRKFAAQLADQTAQIRDEETKKPDSVSCEEPERIVIDVDDCDKEEHGDFNEPISVQHTEAFLELIKLMETKKPDSVSSEEPERIVIGVDPCDKEEHGDFNEPKFVQHTETSSSLARVPNLTSLGRGPEHEQFIHLGESLPSCRPHGNGQRSLAAEEIKIEDADKEKECVIDIDACDEKNPSAVIEYVVDIYTLYRKSEERSCVPPNYMDNQQDLNGRMRKILDDWLIEVHDKFELMEETLYITINVIDRFLAVHLIVRKKLQLVGVTALLLACKYEEECVPAVDDLIFISDNAYTRSEVVDMEMLMANTLQFKFSLPTPYVFMKRFLKAVQSDKKLEALSFYMIELCLVEYEMLEYLPSKLAASAIYTAQCTLKGFEEWSRTCEFHTGYRKEQLLACARKMVAFHDKAGTGKLTAVFRKYKKSKFCYVARTEPALFLL